MRKTSSLDAQWAVKLHCLSSNNNFSLKFIDAFITSGCSGMLWPSAFTWYWHKNKNSFSFGGKRALCSKKVCVVKFSQKGTFFLSDHLCHKSMMMMVFWPHICNCLACMASLAKQLFWSNVLNRSLLIAEGGTYAKMIYVEKIINC